LRHLSQVPAIGPFFPGTTGTLKDPTLAGFFGVETHFFALKKAEYDGPASVAAKLLPRESVSSRAPEQSRG